MTTENNNIPVLEQQFAELLSMINYHRGRASQAVNGQQLLTAWNVDNSFQVILCRQCLHNWVKLTKRLNPRHLKLCSCRLHNLSNQKLDK